MRLVVVEEYPGELTDASGAEANAKLSKAYTSARRGIAKATGLRYGEVKALGELAELMARAQKKRARQLAKDVSAAARSRDA